MKKSRLSLIGGKTARKSEINKANKLTERIKRKLLLKKKKRSQERIIARPNNRK